MRRIPHHQAHDHGPTGFKSHIHHEDGDIMKLAMRPVVTALPTTSIKSAVDIMLKNKVRRLPIIDAGSKKPLGVVRTSDILDFLGGGEKNKIVGLKYGGNFFAAINGPVKSIMLRDFPAGTTDMSIKDVVGIVLGVGVGSVPILDKEGKIVGILSERDLISYVPATTDAKVSYFMSRHVLTAEPSLKLSEAARVMVSRGFRRMPVVSSGKIVGIVTSVDILNYFGKNKLFEYMGSAKVEDAMSIDVEKIMTRDVIKIAPDVDAAEAAKLMRERGCSGLPVTSDDELEGIITEHDLVRLLF